LRSPLLFLPLLVAVVLIVVGRVNHRKSWGNWVAVAGYAVLAVTIVVGLTAGR
jgi:hypothetical protein